MPDLTEFLMGTGLRIGEVLALHWEDSTSRRRPPSRRWTRTGTAGPSTCCRGRRFDVDWKILRVSGQPLARVRVVKSMSGHRTLELPKLAVQLLWRRDPHGTATGPVFGDSRGGWRDPSNVGRDLREARGEGEFAWVTYHTFRKTCATILDDEGISPRIASNQLGHVNPDFTQKTYMARDVVHPSAAAALDRGLRPAPAGAARLTVVRT